MFSSFLGEQESTGVLHRPGSAYSEVIQRERQRLFQFIRKRVDDEGDAEDILQDVFYQLIDAYRLMKPIEQVGAWLYRVVRNRMIDRFLEKRPQTLNEIAVKAGEED